jgi:hypothetical protein
MIHRQITAIGDWTFGKGISGFATNEQAIELNIRTRLQSWVGDCFFAQQDFVDWSARLDKGQEQNLVAELTSVILKSFGVVAVTSITAVLNDTTRICTVQAQITTIFSPSFQLTMNFQAGTAVTTGS